MRSDHYRKYALDCVLMANRTSEPKTKCILIDMAQAWAKLAQQAESFHSRPYARLRLVSDRSREHA
jgi:hypothetical protein